MLRKLFVVALLATSLIACKSKKAFNFSEDIVKKEKSLMPDMKATETKVADYIKSEQYDSITLAAEKMEKLVQEKINEIQAMEAPDVKEAANFKAASLKYFGFIKSLYTTYKEIGTSKSDEERQETFAKLQKQVGEETEVLNEMQTAQKKYADANGFKIQ